MKQKKTSWGEVATWYDNLLENSGDSFQGKVIMPNLIRIVDPKKGMNILDLACGQGHFTRAFQSHGALVQGSDISPELIEIAKKHSPSQITYFVASAENFANAVPPLVSYLSAPDAKAGIFDVVTIVLALQNIENVPTVFGQCAKVLKPGGRIVFVINHPAFRIPKRSGWGWDDKDNKQYRRIDAYMSDDKLEIDMTPGEFVVSKKKKTVSFHRPLQAYFKALNKAGLTVSRLEEWISHKESQKGPRADEEDRIRKEIPMFLCIEARK